MVNIVLNQRSFLNNIRHIRHSRSRLFLRPTVGVLEPDPTPTLIITDENLDPYFFSHLGERGQDWELVIEGRDAGHRIRQFLNYHGALK